MAKSSLNKFKRFLFWVRSHKLYSLFIFIVLLVVGFFVYEKIALELNKQAFAQARVAINTVYADIVSQVGQPDNSKQTSECSRSHVAIGDGPLSCYLDTEFIYAVTNKQQADQLMKNIKSVINNNTDLFVSSSAPTSIIYVNPAPSSGSNSEINYYSTSGLFCAIKYVYDTPKETFLELLNHNNKKTFFAALSCSGDAREAFYSLQN